MQTLDRILVRLTEPQENRQDALVLGRLGFLEWLVSLPDEGDVRHEARLAHERAAPLKQAMPAIGVLCELLVELQRLEQPEASAGRSVMRRRGRRRRSLH